MELRLVKVYDVQMITFEGRKISLMRLRKREYAEAYLQMVRKRKEKYGEESCELIIAEYEIYKSC